MLTIVSHSNFSLIFPQIPALTFSWYRNNPSQNTAPARSLTEGQPAAALADNSITSAQRTEAPVISLLTTEKERAPNDRRSISQRTRALFPPAKQIQCAYSRPTVPTPNGFLSHLLRTSPEGGVFPFLFACKALRFYCPNIRVYCEMTASLMGF